MRCLVLALVVVPIGVPVCAQSLGEAAAREKERRQKIQGEKPRVVTGEDLKEGSQETQGTGDRKDKKDGKGNRDGEENRGGKDSKDPKDKGAALPPGEHLSEGGLPKSAQKTPDEAPRDEARGRLVAEIRERYFRADAEVKRAEARLATAERELESSRSGVPTYHGNSTRYRAEQGVEQARRALAAAKEKRDAIEDEARREGLYPGDLR
jgi:hypothetical protein